MRIVMIREHLADKQAIIDEGNVILNPTPDAITIDSITTGPGTNSGKMATIAFTASGDVDVYASDDLQTWGVAIAEDVSASPFVEDDLPDAKRFYLFLPAGDPAP